MHPVLFELFGYEFASYGVSLVVAFAVGIVVARRRANARGLDPEAVEDGCPEEWVFTRLRSTHRWRRSWGSA